LSKHILHFSRKRLPTRKRPFLARVGQPGRFPGFSTKKFELSAEKKARISHQM